MNKLFNKSATIITSNNDKYVIESGRYFIMPKRKNNHRNKHKYGNACTITKVEPETNELLIPNDISFILETYSLEDNRLRFLEETFKNTKSFDTEEHNNGKELPITVVEGYEDKVKSITSIGDIVVFESDIPEKSYKLDIKVLRLIRKLTEKSSNKKDQQ